MPGACGTFTGGIAGEAEGSAPLVLPMGQAGDKDKGQLLCSDGAILYLDHGNG